MNKTIGAISLQENQSMALSSTFTRTRRGHGPATLGELDSFNIQFGHYPRNHQDDSPTQLKMKRTAILLNSNNSFEKYLREMKKRLMIYHLPMARAQQAEEWHQVAAKQSRSLRKNKRPAKHE